MDDVWQPMETATAHNGILMLAVRSGDERRVFVAAVDYHTPTETYRWQTTHGWLGWDLMYESWEPYAWKPLPEAP